jgi:drug/metabolite transporter (DMT)-like permease
MITMSSRRRPTAPLGASLIVLSSVFYASYGIWTKLMGNFFGGYTASAVRSVLVLVILLPLAVGYHQLERINWRSDGRYILGMIISSLFNWGPLYFAILHAGVGIALSVNYAGIVVGMFVFGWLFAGERFTRDKLLATALSFAGLWLIFTPNAADLGWTALLAATVSGLSGALNSVMVKRVSCNATQSTLLTWSASAIGSFVMAITLREARPALGWHAQWLYLVWFAVASVAASWLFIRGLKLIDAGAAGILGLLEIVFGVLFGAGLFHERIGVMAALGIMVIIAAAAIPYVNDYNTQQGTLMGS